jgi:hypothetical protein
LQQPVGVWETLVVEFPAMVVGFHPIRLLLTRAGTKPVERSGSTGRKIYEALSFSMALA